MPLLHTEAICPLTKIPKENNSIQALKLARVKREICIFSAVLPLMALKSRNTTYVIISAASKTRSMVSSLSRLWARTCWHSWKIWTSKSSHLDFTHTETPPACRYVTTNTYPSLSMLVTTLYFKDLLEDKATRAVRVITNKEWCRSTASAPCSHTFSHSFFQAKEEDSQPCGNRLRRTLPLVMKDINQAVLRSKRSHHRHHSQTWLQQQSCRRRNDATIPR